MSQFLFGKKWQEKCLMEISIYVEGLDSIAK